MSNFYWIAIKFIEERIILKRTMSIIKRKNIIVLKGTCLEKVLCV